MIKCLIFSAVKRGLVLNFLFQSDLLAFSSKEFHIAFTRDQPVNRSFAVSKNSTVMTHTQSTLQFAEGGIIKEICARIAQLKKDGSNEMLITDCGKSINLRDLLSVDGVNFGL